MGSDGRVHTTFTHNPSSLRLSSTDPNLQNIPRGNDSEEGKWVKACFRAGDGHAFWERDYLGIEAVLVGYFVGSQPYTRLAKLGVHAFFASHLVGRPADLSWSDQDLSAYFKQLKKEDPVLYDTAKRCVHGSNYMMTPKKMAFEYPETFPTTKRANEVQGLYFEMFPEIKRWHRELCERVDGTKRRVGDEGETVTPWTLGVCHVVNPFGYTHRFYNVLDWTKMGTEWISSYGEDAKRLISFLPQSTAAAIIKRSTKRLWYEYPWVGETMRLLIHDAIFGESKEENLETCLRISQDVMEAPIMELPLDPTWGMGTHLSIRTEAKVGTRWSEMH